MYCYKCGKELPDDAVFCSGCGASTKRTPMPLKSAVRSAVGSLAVCGANRDSMRFILVGLAAVCALLLVQCLAGLSSISVTEEEWAQLVREITSKELERFSDFVSIIYPVIWPLEMTGFCGLAFSGLAISCRMSGGKQLLRFSLVVSFFAGIVSLLLVVARTTMGIGVQDTLVPIWVGVLLCSTAGLIIMAGNSRFLLYHDDASKPHVSGVLIALVFFLVLELLQSAWGICSTMLVSAFGILALAARNALIAVSVGTAYLGWSLILCSITGFVMRMRMLRFGLSACFGVGASVGIVHAVNYYSSLKSSIMQLENNSELIGMIHSLELFPPVQIFLFHCLLGLFIGKVMSGRLRLRSAILVPIICTGLQLLLTYCLMTGNIGFPQLGLVGFYYAQILTIAISMIIVGFLRVPSTKGELGGATQFASEPKYESILAQDSEPLFTPPPEEDGQAAGDEDQLIPSKRSAPKKWVRVVLNIVIMLVVAAVCFLVIVVLPRVLDGDSLLAMTSSLLRTIRN